MTMPTLTFIRTFLQRKVDEFDGRVSTQLILDLISYIIVPVPRLYRFCLKSAFMASLH
jgi:hypothetical protein